MTLYAVLRRAAGTALGWYYGDVVAQGREHLPSTGAVLLVANHPNALVDAMLVGASVPRRVLLTAKATLFEQPALAAALRAVGVVPLRRARDEQLALSIAASESSAAPSVTRNADAFQAVTAALAKGAAVLVFPEGISHDAPALAPLKTGAARMVLMAFATGVTPLSIVPVGLVYEEKERPRSRVLVRFGAAIEVGAWLSAHEADASALTAEIDAGLRQVTLNFATAERAQRAIRLARTLDAIAREGPPLARPRELAPESDLARRIDAAYDALDAAPHDVIQRADTFIAATEAFERRLREHGVALSELRLSPLVRHGARFALRESLLVLLGAPAALVDRIAHDIPVRTARAFARRSLATDPSRDQPAMRTMLLAMTLLPLWYAVLGGLLAYWFGWRVAVLALGVMALSASTALAQRDRLSRSYRRARTYLALRAHPELRAAALAEAGQLLQEAQALELLLHPRSAVGAPGR